MSAGAGEHTPEPWIAETGGGRGAWICGATKEWTALSCGDSDQSAEANAARIVACVNACAGIPTDQLSTLMGEVRGVLEAVRSDCQSTIDNYERNGPSFTSPRTGDEYEPADFVQDKMRELLAHVTPLLAKLPVQP